MCSLCLRTVERGNVCLTCRSSALKLDDERRARAGTRSGRLAQLQGAEIRRSWVIFPAFVVGSLAIMSSVVGTVLSEAGTARTERRARDALLRLCDAEKTYRQKAPAFATLEKLQAANLAPASTIPGYQLRVDLAKDGSSFWARAVPEQDGLRGMIVDSRGTIVYDGGGE